jgi:hypothetical protein
VKTLNESTINVRQLINDRRFQTHVGSILDIIALLKDLEDHLKFIDTQACRANPLDVAVNLRRIHEEANGSSLAIEKMRRRLYKLYEVSLQDIYSDHQQEDEEMNNGKKNDHQQVTLRLKRNGKLRRRRVFRGGGRKKASETAASRKQ